MSETTKKCECCQKLPGIGKLINTQDNRATSDPIFVVQQKVRIWGFDSDHCENYVWVDAPNDHVEADEEEAARLDDLESRGEDTGDWQKVYYLDRWEFVTACFTEKGCEDYIAANGHNLTEPRIYVGSTYRNAEFNTVRCYLSSLDG